MAAYAAVICLKRTISGLLNSYGISSTREMLEAAYNEVTSLQQVLERSNESSSRRSRSSHERVDGLEGQIRDFAHKLEDVLELHELNSDEEVMRQEITSLGEAVKKMGTDYSEELSRGNSDDDDNDAILSRINDFDVEMVGHSSQFTELKDDYILKKMRPVDLWFYAFYGEEGSGRTAAAKSIFEDERQGRGTQIFDCWAWVRVGTEYDMKQVLIRIIAQVDNLAADYELLISLENERLSKYLYKLLEHRIYMIVLEDVHDVELVNYLKTTSLPDNGNGSIVFLTTTSYEVAQWTDMTNSFGSRMAGTFEEIMWYFIHKLLSANEVEECISQEMEVAIDMIIQNCGYLYIAALKTVAFLSKVEKTVEEWSKIAADKENPIFRVEDEILEIRKMKMEMQYKNSDIVETMLEFFKWLDEDIKRLIRPERSFSRMQIISVSGMVGIGKTTFVTKIWKDKSVLSHFHYHVWITLGQNYQAEEILFDILAQIYPNIHVNGDEKLMRNLCEQLSSKRCLIVLDDLWSKEPLLHLRNLFPDIWGITLVTTRLRRVAEFEKDDHHLEMELLDKEESWCLLHQKVFGGGLCPPELEKVGRKIAEKCDGLPLLILTVADELLKVEISQEHWNKVASGKEKSVFKNAHDKISMALLPSYQSLPQHQKPCFLYIGVFREKLEIPMSNLTDLLIAEGFLEPHQYCQSEEDFVAQCLSELVDTSLVMAQHKVHGDFQIKTCRLHSVFWHLSNSQAAKNNFFHAMNCYDDCSIESIERQRRLCIRNSILLGMKDVQESLASNTSAHSLLCVSPLHQYPVPLNFDLRLLRVMNALTIRLYEFPMEVVRLVYLRYFSLTCNGKLPPSISNLWRLQFLIVDRYMNIKSSKNYSLLPVEIWDMKELKHLQIMGGYLPDNKSGSSLLKLSTLVDVSAESCRDEVLKWISNVKRLGILIELAPNDDEGNSNSLRRLNNIYLLDKLESLKCVVVNPQIRCEVVSRPAPITMFPPSLKELSLSGLGYPWEHMSIIGKLKNLEVLKLKHYAFQGPRWHMDRNSWQFEKLKFLLIEDTNLVQLKSTLNFALELECLFIKHCYKLQELPSILSSSLRKIEIVDCNPLTETWAVQLGLGIRNCKVSVHNSWSADTR